MYAISSIILYRIVTTILAVIVTLLQIAVYLYLHHRKCSSVCTATAVGERDASTLEGVTMTANYYHRGNFI